MDEHENDTIKQLLRANFNDVCLDYYRLSTEWKTISLGNL